GRAGLGGGPGPGSAGRHDGGGSGLAAIHKYGGGEYDPVTGLWEYYEFPPGHEARGQEAEEVSWRDLLDQWVLLEADWLSEYHERLSAVWAALSWREFVVGVVGLFAADTRLSRHFAPPTPDPMGGAV
ncbi:MAG TPA: hypothetical protein PLQ23_16840, partial [Dermatophilaceae bacterium]|nr:hypothetical protein [Dermatophilaceae bacterium]